MKFSPACWLALLLTAISAAIGAWTWTHLPPGGGIATNYLGLDGVRHVGLTRAPLWMLPAISAVLTLGLSLARVRRGAEAALLPLDMTLIALAGLLLVTQTALVGRAFDPAFNVLQPVGAATGVLLIAVGNYLGKARRNAVFGVRTPWTLADATVWDRTHRFTGVAMVLGGLVLIALALLLKDSVAVGLSIALCAALPTLAGVVRSAAIARRVQRG